MLEVMIRMVFLKSTVLPRPSVRLPVLEDLQQQVEHVRMGFFDFVQQNHGVRGALYPLGELAALLIAYVARRRTDQLAETECFSMNSDISKRISDFSLPKRNWASVRAISVFPTPVGPKEEEAEPIGRRWIFEPRPGPANCACQRR